MVIPNAGLITGGLALAGQAVNNWTTNPAIRPDNSSIWQNLANRYFQAINNAKSASDAQGLAMRFAEGESQGAAQGKPPADLINALNSMAQNKISELQQTASRNYSNNTVNQPAVDSSTIEYNGQQYPIQNGMVNINGIGIDAKAIQNGQVSVNDVLQNWAASPANPQRSLGVQAPTQTGQNTNEASTARQGEIKVNQPAATANASTVGQGTPQDYINQLLSSVGQGQTQQEDAVRQQFQTAQPQILNAINAALVKQSGGGRGGLDTGGAISASLQQTAKNNVDLNTALADVAKYYSTLKQNALGQALTGSLNLAQMGQQAGQFGQTLAANNAQNLNQTELQKYLAQLQSQQQNKQLSQSANEFAKSFGLQQQQQDWTQQQANLNRQYQLQDYQTQGNLAKELANMQPKAPDWSYWLNPLAQGIGQYYGSKKSGGTV